MTIVTLLITNKNVIIITYMVKKSDADNILRQIERCRLVSYTPIGPNTEEEHTGTFALVPLPLLEEIKDLLRFG